MHGRRVWMTRNVLLHLPLEIVQLYIICVMHCYETFIFQVCQSLSLSRDVNLYPWIETPSIFAAFFGTCLLLILIVAQETHSWGRPCTMSSSSVGSLGSERLDRRGSKSITGRVSYQACPPGYKRLETKKSQLGEWQRLQILNCDLVLVLLKPWF
jgi:hypothetical protein